jgi:ABC-type Fe3+ transport system substrate-binding protein
MIRSAGRRLSAVLCAVGIVTLAGCASSQSGGAAPSNTTAATSPATEGGSTAGGDSTAAKASGSITVYGWSGDWDLWFKDWASKFKAQTGVTINYISGPGTAMRQRIAAEKASKSDIFVGTPSDNYTLAQQGLLADIPWDQVPTANAIDPKFKGEQVAIWGYDMELLAYNTKYLNASDAPTSWKDLTDPKWKGKLGLSDPTQEGATRSTLVMIDKYGQQKALDLVSQMYDNAKLTYSTPGAEESALAGGSVQVEDTSMGSVMVMLQQAGASIKTVVPSEGVFLMLNSIGIMKDAPNPAGALEFLKFFLSDDMQNVIMNQLGISIAVDSNVKVANKNLADGLGGQTPAQVLKNAYVPNWADLVKTDASGQSQLSSLYTEIAAAAKN